MRLDHLVVHIDDDPGILNGLRPALAAAWLHYQPARGPTGPGTRSEYIRTGDVVIELVRLQRPGARAWYPHWMERSRTGQRGLFSIVLETPDLDRLASELRGRGIQTRGPESLEFRLLLGLLRTSAPWQILFLPALAGTGLDISFIEYAGASYPEPGAEEDGPRIAARGLEISLPHWDENLDVLRRIFPWLVPENDRWSLALENTRLSFLPGPQSPRARLRTAARGANGSAGKTVAIQDLLIEVD